MTDQFTEKNVRNALCYLMNSLTVLHNEYGAGGAWVGCPVPLHEISKRLDVAESILINGTDATIELVQEPEGNFKKYSEAVNQYIDEKYKDNETTAL